MASKRSSARVGLAAEHFYGAVAQSLGIAHALLRKLDDGPGDRRRHRIGAIDQSELAKRGLERCGQLSNVLRSERVVVFEDEAKRHVEARQETVRCASTPNDLYLTREWFGLYCTDY
jgi:hypothetical protein